MNASGFRSVKAVRLAAAILLTSGLIRAAMTYRADPPSPVLSRQTMLARVAAVGGDQETVTIWQLQIDVRKPHLLSLRRAILREPELRKRKSLASELLAMFDSDRLEEELLHFGSLRAQACRLQSAKRLGSLTRRTAVNAGDLGAPLGGIARERLLDRRADPARLLPLDVFRSEFCDWLSAGR